MEDPDTDVFGTKIGKPPPLSTHCDVPLKYSKQRAALGIPSEGQYISRGNPCKRELNIIKTLSGITSFDFLDVSSLQYHLLNEIHPLKLDHQIAEWKQQNRVAHELWMLSLKSLTATSMLPLPSSGFKLNGAEEEYLLNNYLLKCFWEEGVLSSGSSTFSPTSWWKKHQSGISFTTVGSFHFYAGTNLFVISSPYGNCLASRDHLVIISDLSSQRYLLRFLCILEKTKDRTDFPSLQQLNKLLINGDKILNYAGNLGYDYIYTLEPVCTSKLVGGIPVIYNPPKTFENVITESVQLIANKLNIHDFHTERQQIIADLEQNPVQLAQVFGLYRIWGHPTLEPLEGTTALKTIATKVRGLNHSLAESITNKFKEEFIIRYLRIEHKWPELDLTLLSPQNPIKTSYLVGGPFPKNHKDYSRESLTLVSFKPIFPIDPKFDLVEMIADKAMSLSTPELIDHLTTGKGVGTAIERSVLVQWLKSGLHDPKEFLMFIDQFGFTENESSVGVKEKEREGKIRARLYGLMTLLKRMYIVLTEALLAEHILKYFPEITMTDDELSLDKKRFQFNSRALQQQALFTSLDFSKWNSNMREAETRGVFKTFDQLFGFKNCFQRTHEMFKNSFIYLLNGSYLPTFTGGNFQTDLGSWTGHLGGIEGLRQKGWTIWTVSLILYVAEEFPMKLNLMGQGDNQVLREIYPKTMTKDRQLEVHQDFMTKLNRTLEQIGPPLKMEETWTSRDFYVYGKYLIFNGAPLPLYGKRVCRMFRLSNEDYPTLESTISSLTANVSSAISNSYDPGVLMYLYYLELTGTFQLFFRSNYLQPVPLNTVLSKNYLVTIPHKQGPRRISVQASLTKSFMQSDLLYIRLNLLPRCLGGFPVSNIFSMVVRGFPDELSFAISSLRLMYIFATPELQGHIKNMLNPYLNPDINYSLLFDHPTSLNIDTPPAPSEARRNTVIKFLKTSFRVENPYLKTFLSFLESPYEEILINYLAEAKPFMPRTLSLITSATVEARARHIANRLQKTKTISSLARLEGEEDLYSTISRCEINHTGNILRFITGQAIGTNEWKVEHCSVNHAQTMRDVGWNKRIEGVDCVPPQEFLFIEHPGKLLQCSSLLDLSKGSIIVRFDHQSQITNSPLFLGPYNPYRGSTTKQKITGYGEKLAVQADPLLKKVFKAFNLIGWGIVKEGNLSLLLKQMLYSRTDLDARYLILESDQVSGSIHHRLQDERTGHGGSVSILPNFGTRFVFDTFPLTEYSKGSKNVNLMFQSIMSYSTTLISWALSLGWIPETTAIHIHVKKACCVKELNENLIDCDSLPPACFIRHEGSPYLFKKASDVLPELLKSQTITASLELTMDQEESSRRLISSVSYEILNLLSPASWDLQEHLDETTRIVINWCLRLPLITTIEFTCLRLIVHFSPAARSSTPQDFLARLSERIERSPLRFWSRLTNLIFCPNFSHELAGAPYFIQISGNPCLSDINCAINIKEACKTVILSWATDASLVNRLSLLPLISPIHGGITQHPALMSVARDWILGKTVGHLPNLRRITLKLLKKESTTEENNFDLIPALQAIRTTERAIFPDNIENLCKRAKIVPFSSESKVSPYTLPPGAHTLITFDHSKLTVSETIIRGTTDTTMKSYKTHYWRQVASPTTGNYKGLSLISYLFSSSSPGNTLCLGDGSGGYTWAFLRSCPDIKVYYNSLIQEEKFLEQVPPIPYIPSLAGWPELEQRVTQLDLTNNGISDITDPDYSKFLKTHLLGTFKGAICDAEIQDRSNFLFKVRLAEAMIALTNDLSLQWICLKAYTNETSVIRAQISILLSRFEEVQIVRSDFSSFGNTEVFLFAKNPTVQTALIRTKNSLTGEILSDALSPIFQDLKMCCEEGRSELTQEIINKYNNIISPKYDSILNSRLLNSLPMLANIQDLSYPHSVLRWIRSTCQLKPGMPRLYKTRLETQVFNDHLLTRLIIAWIVFGIWSESLDINSLEHYISNSCLIWYYLKDGSWEFSLSSIVPPEHLQGPRLLVWSVPALITTKHIKLIQRLLGIASLMPFSPISLSLSIERGNLSPKGSKVVGERLPQHPWVEENIYQGTLPETKLPKQTKVQTIKEIWEQRHTRKRRIHRI